MANAQVVLGGIEVVAGATGILIPDPATTAGGAALVADGLRRIGDGLKD